MAYIAIPTKAVHLVRIEIKEDGDTFVATSPDLNIVITANSLGDELHDKITKAIDSAFQAMGQIEPMTVIRVNHPVRDGYWYFAAIPASAIPSG
jgi:hypothetical protein